MREETGYNFSKPMTFNLPSYEIEWLRPKNNFFLTGGRFEGRLGVLTSPGYSCIPQIFKDAYQVPGTTLGFRDAVMNR